MSENKPENQFSQRSKFGLSEKAIEKFFQNMSEIDHPNYDPPENLSLDAAKKIKSKFDKIEQSSLIDPLTGCYNNKFLEHYIQKNFDPQREDKQLGTVYFDVNGLKSINDGLGHKAGDELIKNAAVYIESLFRSEDLVIHLHGDEFLVICKNQKQTDENIFSTNFPVAIEQRVISKLPDGFVFGDRYIQYQVAAGVAIFDRAVDGDDLRQTIARADELMYKNKKKMKNFDVDMLNQTSSTSQSIVES